jgi:RNA polymerase sigma-70 factor (ECF subfamily)
VSQVTDDELITAVGRGDRTALAVLFERHYQAVHGMCYRMTGEASVAEDLTQDSFVRVLKYAKGFERRSAFTTWLYRIVRNVCLDHLDAESRVRARMERAASEPVPDAGFPTPADARLETLREALYALPPERREVLVLSRYQGLSYAEIADVCDTTVGAIKVRAHRAMRELRQRFEELEGTT